MSLVLHGDPSSAEQLRAGTEADHSQSAGDAMQIEDQMLSISFSMMAVTLNPTEMARKSLLPAGALSNQVNSRMLQRARHE